jgi:hypothetical protein
LQDWQNRVLSTNINSWPSCTSVGGDDFFGDISPVQTGENEDEEKEEEQEDLGKGFNGDNDKKITALNKELDGLIKFSKDMILPKPKPTTIPTANPTENPTS